MAATMTYWPPRSSPSSPASSASSSSASRTSRALIGPWLIGFFWLHDFGSETADLWPFSSSSPTSRSLASGRSLGRALVVVRSAGSAGSEDGAGIGRTTGTIGGLASWRCSQQITDGAKRSRASSRRSTPTSDSRSSSTITTRLADLAHRQAEAKTVCTLGVDITENPRLFSARMRVSLGA